MTIAIGMHASDGLVLAADTEEGDGFLKTSVKKMRLGTVTEITGGAGGVVSHMRDTAAVAIAGAGTSSYCDAAMRLMMGPCMAQSKQHDPVFISELSTPLRAFYREHVLPFMPMPAHERPDFQLLLAVTDVNAAPQDRHRLFRTDKMILQRAVPHAAIGVGEMFATMLMRRLHREPPMLDLRSTAALVAYIMFHVKESVPGCGRWSHIVALQNGTQFYVSQHHVRAMETVFLNHSSLEGAALACALSEKRGETAELRGLARNYRAFRSAFGKLAFTKKPFI